MTVNKTMLPTLGALGMGAGLMYLMDPDEGAHRRALIRDKMVHLWHATEDTLEGHAENAANHMQGMMAETRGIFDQDTMHD